MCRLIADWRCVPGHLLALLSCLAGCSGLPSYARPPSHALPNTDRTPLARQLAPQLAAHPDQSGFYILAAGPEALSARLLLIDSAQRAVDAQYFIFEDDRVGDLVLRRLFAAADRGVRVRLLLDDFFQPGNDRRLAGIAAHPNIQVRTFNPVSSFRSCPISRPVAYAFGPKRIKKRMHNKAMVADNCLAIIGGRNIADPYFAADDELAFADIDLLAAGPVASQASSMFDRYWNDPLAIPVEAFVSPRRMPDYLLDVRRRLERDPSWKVPAPPPKAAEDDLRQRLASGKLWTSWAEGWVLYDRPEKAAQSVQANPSAYMAFTLDAISQQASREVLIISPYFVPGRGGMNWLAELRKRGVAVRIITNSLASTDDLASHGAYQACRKDVLRLGVELYELRPHPHDDLTTLPKHDPRAALHAKVFIIDRRLVFVGSYNLDLRSAWMDTQNGIVLHSEPIARQLASIFDKGTPTFTYWVRFRGAIDGTGSESFRWIERVDGQRIYTDEPKTGWRRIESSLLGRLAPRHWL